MSKAELSIRIKELAGEAGFHKAGIARAGRASHGDDLVEWLRLGQHGTMRWMENYVDQRLDVQAFFPGARSVIMVAQNYYTPFQHDENLETAKISRYAWGHDYHKIIRKKLKFLLYKIQELDQDIAGRIFVDTAPVMEKQWAQTAGIGWQGKNTNLLTREFGSWVFLGGIVVNLELEYDEPVIDYCGNCTACLDACPTKALSPYHLDARRCIAYLTIELRDDSLPEEFIPSLQNWIFGCDICQDVCPWNRFSNETDELLYRPEPQNLNPRLTELGKMTESGFADRFRQSPVRRARFSGLMRNIRAVLSARRKTHSESPE